MSKAGIILTLAVLSSFAEGSYLKMPSFSFVGESVTLECNIDHGDLPIIAITWSKDGKQFYKYDPNKSEPVTVTNIEGVQVKTDLCLNGNSVTIGSVSQQSSGVYKCNLQIDHPALDVGEMTGTLKVVQN